MSGIERGIGRVRRGTASHETRASATTCPRPTRSHLRSVFLPVAVALGVLAAGCNPPAASEGGCGDSRFASGYYADPTFVSGAGGGGYYGGGGVYWYDSGDTWTYGSTDTSGGGSVDTSGNYPPDYYGTSDNGDYSGGDGSSASGGTDTSGGSTDPSGGSTDTSGGSSSGDGTSSGSSDGTSSGDGSGDISLSHRLKLASNGGLLRPMSSPVAAAPGCFACTMLCTLQDGVSERAAVGASSRGYDSACHYAVHKIENWAHHSQSQHLGACADVTQGVSGPSATPTAPTATPTTPVPTTTTPRTPATPAAATPMVAPQGLPRKLSVGLAGE